MSIEKNEEARKKKKRVGKYEMYTPLILLNMLFLKEAFVMDLVYLPQPTPSLLHANPTKGVAITKIRVTLQRML